MAMFREHRAVLTESLATMVEINSFTELRTHLIKIGVASWGTLQPTDPIITPYRITPDTRIGWERTFVVGTHSYGVMGFISEDVSCMTLPKKGLLPCI